MTKHGIFLGVIVAYLLFFFFLFGFSGLLFVFFLGLFFVFPVYFILSQFSLAMDENLLFSFLLSLGLFPSFVYYLGFVFKSLKISAIVTFVLFLGVGFLVKKLKK